ncbi:MAG TPA: hypothetical protein VFX49_13320 [Chloroflexota bacterium]|nr:hypothetical protein [Chloroflexota bacterium]
MSVRAFSVTGTAAALSALVALAALQFPTQADFMLTWRGQLDLAVSVWLIAFTVTWAGLTMLRSAWPGADAPAADASELGSGQGADSVVRWWALAGGLLLVCTVELALHADERNPFLATSRPTTGVVDWTVADGYATLLDGHVAQGDGLFLLSMLKLFLGEAPPAPSEFDRRAAHVYLVSLVTRPLGTYWAFTLINLVAWWVASLAVWWLVRRRWPGRGAPVVAATLTATGQGFVFMSTAPQAHALAFAAFAVLLVAADALGVWAQEAGQGRRGRLRRWLRMGWATGAAGLVYLVYLPCLMFFWLFGAGRGRWVGLAAGSGVTLALVLGWERYAAALLGLSFSGGNNDLAGEAANGWVDLTRRGMAYVVGQVHHSSIRGMFVGAFYYPWWALTAVGLAVSGPLARRWSLAVMVAAALPAIAFSTRFNLPRVAYFMYPAVYATAAVGIGWLAERAPSRPARRAIVVGLTALLVALTNADLVGLDQLALWFHHSQGTQW